MKMAELASFPQMSTEQQQLYMRSLNHYRTVLATKDYELNRGITIGREEGRDERSIEIAGSMKADGMPVQIIQKYTGLTIEEINSL